MYRDKTIDRLRGFAMFQVIVVHVLYWGNFFASEYTDVIKSFCLFEMPLFFFITGASSSFSKTDRYFEFVRKRFRRVLIPYWVFAIICAVLSIVKYSLEGNISFLLCIKILLSWLVPVNRQMTSVSYLTWALWFIPVYLSIVLIIPILKKMKCSKRRMEFAFAILGFFVVTCLLKMGWIQNIAFYSFWTYAGLFYSDIRRAVEQKYARKYFLYIVIGAGMTIVMFYFGGQSLNMQANKFPPNITFLIFSIMMMSLIMLMIQHLDRIFDVLEKHKLTGMVLDLFSTRSMTIFLYQVFAFNLTIPSVNMLIHGQGIIVSIIKSLLCLMGTILACSLFAVIFGRIEKVSHVEHRITNEKNNRNI